MEILQLYVNWLPRKLFRPIVETRIYHEYQNVLSRPRFKFSAEDIQAVLILFKNEGLWIVPPPILDDVPDPSDLPFIELAYHTRAPVITGNAKHFPDDILVLTPKELLERMRNQV